MSPRARWRRPVVGAFSRFRAGWWCWWLLVWVDDLFYVWQLPEAHGRLGIRISPAWNAFGTSVTW
jgi:hypothetical protein